ncbi:MAG: alpha amylase C-terminal domain-containing protein [Deltaproteobacteria bacterium]|nr:alpha amylase C-terminal domain-containing protein [Candidatus Anaeroferrophillus wilburensis]MBN2888499.1 alpha amylase C-terminal domain-containing protein [Deltaproteobacteria bacterium]
MAPTTRHNNAIAALLAADPYLQPYEGVLRRRQTQTVVMAERLTGNVMELSAFAAGHHYFGLHFNGQEWIFREWAPHATALFLIGDFTGWQEEQRYALQRLNTHGEWEIRLPAECLSHRDLFRLRIHWQGGAGDRLPAYATRVVQDPQSLIFNAQVWQPPAPYRWQHPSFTTAGSPLLIYEAHVGMAQEEEKVGSYREFSDHILPIIADAGYNTIQLMAIQEHPYYASFGYHVANFFAASSRFGTPEELKELIDRAHGLGLAVIMDIIHSHAVNNEVEGLSRFDGTDYQYFHQGLRGIHQAWDSRCFNYHKPEVLHFLLSNCRFWLEEYHFDGFRFDGITSMLYDHHGLGKAFTSYDDYFDNHVDEEAVTYLTLANTLIHELKPEAITIAEDISGMPGLAAPVDEGGMGFDYRFAMGVPDLWIKLTKDIPDEAWPMGNLWHEMTNRRPHEKTISYAESHDQALVGDQTLIFRLIGSAMYDHMAVADRHLAVDRGMALHKMIRLLTLATAGHGYLTFMGNEFGHPEWIDFPRAGNNWSYHYARRQWHLKTDPGLKYHFLAAFDRDMISLATRSRLLEQRQIDLLHEHNDDKVMIFQRGTLLFAFNFHPHHSYTDYRLSAPPGSYELIFDSDEAHYGGHNRLQSNQQHLTIAEHTPSRHMLSLYLPARTVQVLEADFS